VCWARQGRVSRFHGRPRRHRHLAQLGERAGRLAEEVPSVRMMFNDNRGADAPDSAQRMRELLDREVSA
jgi:uncharacterized protein YecE (DUF72 family)